MVCGVARRTRSAHSSQVQTLKGASLCILDTNSLTCAYLMEFSASDMLQLCERCNIEEVQISSFRRFCQERNQFSFVFFFASNVLTKLANVCVLLCCCCQGFKKVMLKSSFRELFFTNTHNIIELRGCHDKQTSDGTHDF